LIFSAEAISSTVACVPSSRSFLQRNARAIALTIRAHFPTLGIGGDDSVVSLRRRAK
jgi:hypothetical protein